MIEYDGKWPCPSLEAKRPEDQDKANVLQQVMEHIWDQEMNDPIRVARRKVLYDLLYHVE